jgi:hypothetical protein
MSESVIPHVNEIIKPNNNDNVFEKQRESVLQTIHKRQDGQTQFTIQLSEPLNPEVAQLLSNNGYSYHTSSTIIYQSGIGNKEKHTLTFGVAPLKNNKFVCPRKKYVLDWLDFDYWF